MTTAVGRWGIADFDDEAVAGAFQGAKLGKLALPLESV